MTTIKKDLMVFQAVRFLLTLVIAVTIGILTLSTDVVTTGMAIAVFAMAFISRDILMALELGKA